MNHIQHKYIPMQTSPLMIGDTMLQVTETIRPNIDLSNLSPPSKTINYSDNSCCSVLASNNTFLFSNQKHNLCLVNQKMILAKEVVWPFNTIIDMCWSLILNQFILINENDLFLVNENIMSIEKRHTISNNKWLSCTYSDASLFLSTKELSSSVHEFNFSSMIEFVQQLPCSFTHKKNEQIDSIVYNN